MYQIHVTATGNTLIVKDGTLWIPTDDANYDYQAFLAWCAEGNEPEEWSAE